MIDTIVKLSTNMHQQGPGNLHFSQLLKHLHIGNCTDSDYTLLQSRIFGKSEYIDFNDPKWRLSPIIMSENAVKDALNGCCTTEFAKQTNQTLHWYHSSDTCKGSALSKDELVSYLHSIHSGRSHGRMGRLLLVLGMPVLISQNFDVDGGIMNGSYGFVKRIWYTVDDNGICKLTSCVVEVKDSNDAAMPHLQPHEVPVLSDSIDMRFKE